MAFTVENMTNNDAIESMEKGPDSKVGWQAEKELNEALNAIKAHEDAKRTVESTGIVAQKEMQEVGISSFDSPDKGNLKLSEDPEPLSRNALINSLEGNMFNVVSKDPQMREELAYVFTPAERVKMLNQAPESAKQIQFETGVQTV